MIKRIRYKLLMRRLRSEIARTLNGDEPTRVQTWKKPQAAVSNACKAYGSIV